MNLNQIATTVKEILLDYPSDYDSKSIEKADRRRFKVTKWMGSWVFPENTFRFRP